MCLIEIQTLRLHVWLPHCHKASTVAVCILNEDPGKDTDGIHQPKHSGPEREGKAVLVTWASVQLACRPVTLRLHIHNTPIKCCWLRPHKSGGETLPLQPPRTDSVTSMKLTLCSVTRAPDISMGTFTIKAALGLFGSTNGACVLDGWQLTILNSYSLSHSHVFQRSDGQWHATQHHML